MQFLSHTRHWKTLVFWIRSCFWEVVTHGGSTVLILLSYLQRTSDVYRWWGRKKGYGQIGMSQGQEKRRQPVLIKS